MNKPTPIKQMYSLKMDFSDKNMEPFKVHTGYQTAEKFFIHRLELGFEANKCFYVASLNGNNEIIAYTKLYSGTDKRVTWVPREILQFALLTNASKIITAHNNTLGIVKPSRDTIKLVQDLESACNLIGIELLNHFIVSGIDFSSLSELGHVTSN
ncbi:JAB domain-containing protein [uncultured Enterococcus sp.]|uniref:JAB domain-containing protein n=1 Tax=uncultured Enterococcus sp. TaxID=167972 RepID=UPI002AA7D527|nr:JAB domain-containing protein [uncultured Enterococcus sp.]